MFYSTVTSKVNIHNSSVTEIRPQSPPWVASKQYMDVHCQLEYNKHTLHHSYISTHMMFLSGFICVHLYKWILGNTCEEAVKLYFTSLCDVTATSRDASSNTEQLFTPAAPNEWWNMTRVPLKWVSFFS